MISSQRVSTAHASILPTLNVIAGLQSNCYLGCRLKQVSRDITLILVVEHKHVAQCESVCEVENEHDELVLCHRHADATCHVVRFAIGV